MIFSKACQYGIQACMYLASWHKPKFIPVHQISNYLDIPKYFLVKILQKLTKQGILKSKRGPNGGISLTTQPNRIHLIKIVQAIEGNDLFDQCALGCGYCDDSNPCSFHDQWLPVRKQLKKELSQTSLLELTRNAKTKFPYIAEADNR